MKACLALVFMMAVGVWTDSVPIPKPAMMRKCRRPSTQEDGPHCQAAMRKWRWDDPGTSRSCVSYLYGGCRGTDNLFATQAECEEECQLMTRVPHCPPPPVRTGTLEAGCQYKDRMKMEDGCREEYITCPNKEPTSPCQPILHAMQLPPDCQYIQVKGVDGCSRSMIDCKNGPNRETAST